MCICIRLDWKSCIIFNLGNGTAYMMYDTKLRFISRDSQPHDRCSRTKTHTNPFKTYLWSPTFRSWRTIAHSCPLRSLVNEVSRKKPEHSIELRVQTPIAPDVGVLVGGYLVHVHCFRFLLEWLVDRLLRRNILKERVSYDLISKSPSGDGGT